MQLQVAAEVGDLVQQVHRRRLQVAVGGTGQVGGDLGEQGGDGGHVAGGEGQDIGQQGYFALRYLLLGNLVHERSGRAISPYGIAPLSV
ncbi:hypothetical protein D3C72_2355560 [compost metagenome]